MTATFRAVVLSLLLVLSTGTAVALAPNSPVSLSETSAQQAVTVEDVTVSDRTIRTQVNLSAVAEADLTRGTLLAALDGAVRDLTGQSVGEADVSEVTARNVTLENVTLVVDVQVPEGELTQAQADALAGLSLASDLTLESVSLANVRREAVTLEDVELRDVALEVNVQEPAEPTEPTEPAVDGLEITSLLAPDNVTLNQTVFVSAFVRNTGEENVSATAEFRIEGEVVDSVDLELEPGDRTTVTFAFTPEALGAEPGTVTHGVFVDGVNRTAELTIEEG